MRHIAGSAASLLIGLTAAAHMPPPPAEPAQPTPFTTRLPGQHSAISEAAGISDGLMASRKNWEFLEPDTAGKLKAILESLALDKLAPKTAEQVYISNYRLITTLEFTPSQDRGQVQLSEIEEIKSQASSVREGLKELREKGFLAYNEIQFIITKEGGLKIGILSYGGPRAKFHLDPGAFALGPENAETRAAIWGNVLSSIDLNQRLGIQLSPEQRGESLRSLEGLRAFYVGSGQEDAARLAQTLIVYLTPNASTIRQYADMGRIDAENAELVPPEFRAAARGVNAIVRNVLSPKDIVALEERVKDTACPELALALLALEQEAQVYPKAVVELAHLEIRDAMRFTKTAWEACANKSAEAAGEIVRRYFEEYFKNEYNFGDQTPGLSAGLSLRRTDCSTRAVLAYEMLSLMGFETGTETILAYKDGKPVPGIAAHIYNYLEVPETGRIYFDFCRRQDQEYRFQNNRTIKDTYSGAQEGIEVRVEMSSSKAVDLYGQLLREPVVEEIREFCGAFKIHGGTLSEFLFDQPQYIPKMHRLCAYSAQIDRVFGEEKGEMAAWRTGTQESIFSIFPNFKE